MAWIESHQTLARHPKTLSLAALLKTSKPATLGHLHLLWWWALDYASDGDLSRFDDRTIADAAEWRKAPDAFVQALRTAGWLNSDGTVHDWYDYAGRLVQQRAAKRERMRLARAGTVSARGANVLDTVRPTVPDLPDLPSTTPLPPAAAGGSENGSPRARGVNPRASNPKPPPTVYYRGVCKACSQELHQRGETGRITGHAADCTAALAVGKEGS